MLAGDAGVSQGEAEQRGREVTDGVCGTGEASSRLARGVRVRGSVRGRVGFAEVVARVGHGEGAVGLGGEFDPVGCAVVGWGRGRARSGGGAGIGAMGMAGCGSSTVLAMNIPGCVYSWPLSSEKCSCQRSSRPGEEWTVCMVSGSPPLRVPSFMMATRGCSACTSTGELELACPWCRPRRTSIGAEAVVRAHQLELLVLGDVAQVSGAEFAEGDVDADRLRVLGIVVSRLEIGAVGIGLAGAGQRGLDHLAGGGDHEHIDAGQANFVAGLGDGVLGVGVGDDLRIGFLR